MQIEKIDSNEKREIEEWKNELERANRMHISVVGERNILAK